MSLSDDKCDVNEPAQDFEVEPRSVVCEGDIVQLKCGGPFMVVGQYHYTKGWLCAWSCGDNIKKKYFLGCMLNRYDDDWTAKV